MFCLLVEVQQQTGGGHSLLLVLAVMRSPDEKHHSPNHLAAQTQHSSWQHLLCKERKTKKLDVPQ